MSWINDLCETYDNSIKSVEIDNDETSVPLLPLCHTTNKAHIEIVLNQDGDFLRANVIDANQSRTIIPCTEKSASRASGAAPHPLCDKLQYVADDYLKFSAEGRKSYFPLYLELISKWANSKYSNQKVLAVQKYVEKGTVIHDLVSAKIMFLDEKGKLLSKWQEGQKADKPPIFKLTVKQPECFIRWRVEIPDQPESRLWLDREVWDAWINYSLHEENEDGENGLCYVTGNNGLLVNLHPAKIRNDGDRAKLISSNDKSGFTFRGRFINPSEAVGVSYDASFKAHAALRWLIKRQGFQSGDLAILAWALSNKSIPDPMADIVALIGMDHQEDPVIYTAEEISKKFRNNLMGYETEIGKMDKVSVIGLDSTTAGQGRLSIIYYRELMGSVYLERIRNWFESCTWIHSYRSIYPLNADKGKKKPIKVTFIGAPAPKDIAEAIYGKKLDDKLRNQTIKRLLPCIIDGAPIPRDLVESAIRSATNVLGKENQYDWDKALTIACALYNKQNYKENYKMSLEKDRKSRDYLYGRLLAVAEDIEKSALNLSGENRATNAARLMQRFADHPYSTWRTLELAINPYKSRLGYKASPRLRLIDEIIAAFESNDFISDKRLSGEFLLGYHCQREDFRKFYKNNANENQTEDFAEIEMNK